MTEPTEHFYQVTNTPESKSRMGLFFNFTKSSRKRSGFMAFAILGVYLFAGGVIGFLALNNTTGGPEAKASVDQNALLVASIRLLEDKNYSIGDRVDVFLTIQNPNLVTPVSNIKLQMESASDSIIWESAYSGAQLAPSFSQQGNSSVDQGVASTGNAFTISDLAPSERAEYLVRGRFAKDAGEYLAISAKLLFTNPEGEQTVTTNTVYTNLNSTQTSENGQVSYKLTSPKGKLQTGEKFSLFVERTNAPEDSLQNSGTVLITSIKTGELLLEKNCNFDKDNKCEIIVDQGISQGGSFSSIYRDEKGVSSNILNLTIKGESKFTVSGRAEISTPLGATSINGILPVYVKNVIDANSKITGDEVCTASILDKDSKLISKLESKVNIVNRYCYFLIPTLEQPDQNSSFYFMLEGTNLMANINLVKKPDNLLPLISPNAISDLRPGSPITIQGNLQPKSTEDTTITPEIAGVSTTTETPTTTTPQTTTPPPSDTSSDTSSASSTVTPTEIPVNATAPLITVNATMAVWHVDSGEVKNYTEIGGKKISAVDNLFEVNLPENFLTKQGLYKIKFTFDNKQSTEWLNVNYGSNGIGFVSSYARPLNVDSLVAGNNMDFLVNGLMDKKGAPMAITDQCNSGVWTGIDDINQPILAEGALSGDQCVSSVPSKTITKAGPVTLAYTGKSNSLEIPQAVQFEVKANSPVDYGEINFAYSPAIAGYSNNLFVGPVSDKYNNLADKSNLKIEVKSNSTVIFTQDTEIRQGFASILLPSSVLANPGDVLVSLIDKNNNKTIIGKTLKINPYQTNQKVVLPNFPSVLNGDTDLKVGLTGLDSPDIKQGDKCVLVVSKTSKLKFTVEVPFEKTTGSCNIKQNFGNYRDDSNVMLSMKIGPYTFTDITKIEAGKAANLFRLFPVSLLDPKEGVIAELVSTPILDKYGKPVNGTLNITTNGHDEYIKITEGFARIPLNASKYSQNDIKTSALGDKYLDLVINAKASNLSIATTNDAEIFLGNQSLSNSRWTTEATEASTYAQSDQRTLFEFSGNSCEASLSSSLEPTEVLPSFYYQNKCLVELNKPAGHYKLNITKQGRTIWEQDLNIQAASQKLDYINTQKGYNIRVTAPSVTNLEATISDQGRIFKYIPDKATGIISITQNGLDVTRKYPLQISYFDHTGNKVIWYRTVDGSKLINGDN